ncbi:MAG: C_GCAxxG_C_C family protein [Dehalococcoidales bacterium]|nr:C_GCAxxG_C_C family protein [Dehalococcoidales bacterium]
MQALKKSREEIISKADELGKEYEAKYKGCAPCTFYAVIDALRWGGLEIVPEDIEEKLYPAINMLTAGVCMTGEGSCGAVSGGAMAMGFALGVPRGSSDVDAANQAAVLIRDTMMAAFYQHYGSILCKDVQRKYFGKAWDLCSEEMTREFLSITEGCVIMQAAQWITGFILDEYEKGNLRNFKLV